ncbi:MULTISPECIES: bile acid:sodium symporter family transporter [Bacillus]|uniref:Sodium transporter n=1 Tax=Bacillus halotolerans TaxID=260554 RepID=A0A9Q6A973_9BACI|nr:MULTISPECIES: bile acid:sodium symporter family protein [Bacillus]MBV7317655.1 bile acid:sodium symporter family protein [Halalkalibacterium halodurans]AZV51274.1 bile acid:sodium symporter family protein [Bacillus halotolerans]MCM3353420.1 bile acid:sodium symporter family protein [Bacillus halotolerans]MCP9298271.1 bile acid:sodium symporter family protein [Bacillus halotolerans]MCV0023564.1 bile acid:sodium symporter family protein [Bacillus sp. XT-2]
MENIRKISHFAGQTFGIWVIVFAVLGFSFPSLFSWISSYITIFLGIIMFGMGLTLQTDDFKELIRKPLYVIIGVIAQYTIMPLVAFGLAYGLHLPSEIAVGVILVGCCPGGTASNVMTFLAKGNTALSVAVTTISTLLAPVLTPVLIMLFAKEWLPVSPGSLFISILQAVLIPIIAGLVVKIFFKKQVAKAVHALPLVSVIGIVAIVSAVVSGNRENLLQSGLLIFSVVILHNGFGYLLGFLCAKLLKMDYASQKAIAIEVGMQNSGLGAALATAHFSPLSAVPSAIFSVWHNLSGSLLATYWSKKGKNPKEDSNSTELTL